MLLIASWGEIVNLLGEFCRAYAYHRRLGSGAFAVRNRGSYGFDRCGCFTESAGDAGGQKAMRRSSVCWGKNGYRRHREKYFTFIKTVTIQGIDYDVDVDFLSGKYGGDGSNVSKHVNGIKTLPATGGNFAFEFPPEDVPITYRRSDGEMYRVKTMYKKRREEEAGRKAPVG